MWSKGNLLFRRIFRRKSRSQVIIASAMPASTGMLNAKIVRGYDWNNASYAESIAEIREYIERLQDRIDNLTGRLREERKQEIAEAKEWITTESSLRKDLDPLIKYVPHRDSGVAFLILGILFTLAGNILWVAN